MELLPTITIAIVGHGEDLIHKQLPNIDHNVRIFSRAGQPLCLGINSKNMLDFLKDLYLSDEREENKNTPSSYEMLLKVAEHYKEPEQEKDFKNMLDFELLTEWQKPILNKSLKHTIKTIRKKKHNQIYTPYYDHLYDFRDNTTVVANQNKIRVIETINHRSISNINYNDLPNLALDNFFIKLPDINHRKIFKENLIIDFLKKFDLNVDLEIDLKFLSPNDKEKLEYFRTSTQEDRLIKINNIILNSKLRKYSQEILKIFPFANNYTILREFQTPDSKIHRLVNPNDDIKFTEKANSLKLLETDTTKELKEKQENIRNFVKEENEGKIISKIKLSEIITFLKSEGFVVINIIDLTCRYVSEELSKDKIVILNEKQAMIADEINQKLGGRRIISKKSKKSNKSKKRRIISKKSKKFF